MISDYSKEQTINVANNNNTEDFSGFIWPAPLKPNQPTQDLYLERAAC